MTQTILITGGAGFIGSRLANHLVSNGLHVKVLDNLSPQIHGFTPDLSPLLLSLDKRVEFVHGDVTNVNDLSLSLRGVDTVVHLAAETGTGQSMYNINHYSNVNIGGTTLLLDLIANKGFPVKKVVVASSRAIYGEGKYFCPEHGNLYPQARLPADMERGDFNIHCPYCGEVAELRATDEDSPASPSSVYGITKLTQEQLVTNVGKALGISAIALRYQNVYGPGQSLSNPYTGILSIFSTRLLNKSPINVFEDGKESRDFVYIDDIVSVTAKAVLCKKPMIDIFNVGSGRATDVLFIANTLKKYLNIDVPIKVSGQFRVGDIRHNYADISKAKKYFQYEPKTPLDSGLLNFIEWVKGEKVQVDRYEESLAELKSRGLFR
jgi:dTDP-L-rhamnose 4-epimerase